MEKQKAPIEVEEKKAPADSAELKAHIEESEKSVPDLYQTIVAEEELTKKEVSIKETLITLVDAYLQGRELTPEQGQQLAQLRAKIITGLTSF